MFLCAKHCSSENQSVYNRRVASLDLFFQQIKIALVYGVTDAEKFYCQHVLLLSSGSPSLAIHLPLFNLGIPGNIVQINLSILASNLTTWLRDRNVLNRKSCITNYKTRKEVQKLNLPMQPKFYFSNVFSFTRSG